MPCLRNFFLTNTERNVPCSRTATAIGGEVIAMMNKSGWRVAFFRMEFNAHWLTNSLCLSASLANSIVCSFEHEMWYVRLPGIVVGDVNGISVDFENCVVSNSSGVCFEG